MISNFNVSNFNIGKQNSVQHNGFRTNPYATKLKPLEYDTVSFSGLFKKDNKNTNPNTTVINFSNISKRVDITPKGRDYIIASLPDNMKLETIHGENGEYQLPLKQTNDNTKTVAVLDSFFKPKNGLTINSKGIAHGELVSKIITNNLEDKVGILGIDICKRSILPNRQNLNCALDDILEMKKRGTNIDAVNISSSCEIDYKVLSNILKKQVNPHNIESLRNELIEAFRENPIYKDIIKSVDKINKLVDNGIPVYISAGNKGFALETLSNAISVGSINHSGQKIYPADEPAMPLIKSYEKGIFDLSPIKENGEYIGAGNNDMLFRPEEIGDISRKSKLEIKGTSFSTPYAINSMLKKLGI